MTNGRRRLVTLICICVACACAALGAVWPSAGFVRVEDRNRDGRPDLWRFYKANGELTRVAADTNFDGRSDEQEFYNSRGLIRREVDRNFDNRIDLVETFDPASHEPIRSVIDVDFNGVADFLVLFQNGSPVFSEWLASPVVAPHRAVVTAPSLDATNPAAGGTLAPLVDVFRTDVALSAVNPEARTGGGVAMLSGVGLPKNRFHVVSPVVVSRALAKRAQAAKSSAPSILTTRGPPPFRSPDVFLPS